MSEASFSLKSVKVMLWPEHQSRMGAGIFGARGFLKEYITKGFACQIQEWHECSIHFSASLATFPRLAIDTGLGDVNHVITTSSAIRSVRRQFHLTAS